MELKIQVLNGSTNSCIFQGGISVPDEIPYAPDQPTGSAISLIGLKTAIDYALYQYDRKNCYDGRGYTDIHKDDSKQGSKENETVIPWYLIALGAPIMAISSIGNFFKRTFGKK